MSLEWFALEHVPLAPAAALDFRGVREWEREVVAHLQSLTKVEPPEHVLVGYDSFGPVVVIDYVIYDSDASCKILAVATSLRAQKQGYGSEAVAYVLSLLESGHHGDIEAVIGLVHKRNVLSKAMLTKQGFVHMRPISEVLELWGRPIG